jgi:hypothetical protein
VLVRQRIARASIRPPRGHLPAAGSALRGSQPYFAKGLGPRLGLVFRLELRHEIANSLKLQRTRRDSNPRLLPPEGMQRNRESKVIPRFPAQSGSGKVPQDAVGCTETPSNPAPCRIPRDAEALAVALWRVIRVV